jgi:hypothetical protein
VKWFKGISIIVVIAIVGLQFIPNLHNTSSIIASTDFIQICKPTERVTEILKSSCYNCHSNNTYYPWYSKIQPVGFYLERHIKEGKENLNFSEFGNYSVRRQKSKISSMINQIEKNTMPLPSYTLVHRDAKLTIEDKRVVTEFLESLKDSL